MEVLRKRTVGSAVRGGRRVTFIQVTLTETERRAVDRARLWSCRIRTHANLLTPDLKQVLGRIRNRWNVAIERSTGWVLADVVLVALSAVAIAVGMALRLVFGRRTRLKDLTRGVAFRSGSVEAQRETETMVFATLAAIARALEFAEEGEGTRVYTGGDFHRETPGLTFAGAATAVAGAGAAVDPFTEARAMADDAAFDDPEAATIGTVALEPDLAA